MSERPYSKVHITWITFLAVAVFLISAPAHAVWKNVSVPNVSTDWTLHGVYAVSKTEAWAVGSDFTHEKGVLLHYINGVWVSVTPPNVSPQWELFEVYFTSPSEGWAVGEDSYNGRGVLLHYLNGTWRYVNPPVVSSSWYLRGVHFLSASEGWAVGGDDSTSVANQGVLLHYQNGQWTKSSNPYVLPTWVLNDVHLTSSQQGWAVGVGTQVGHQKGVLLHWENNAWVSSVPPNVGTDWDTVGVHFTSAGEGWAVGNDSSFPVRTGVLLHFFNNAWTPVPFSLPDPNVSWFLSSVYFPGADEGWAVGTQASSSTEETGILIHHLRGSWSTTPPPSVSPQWGLWNLHFSSSDEGWAVGRDQWNGKGVILRYLQKPEITVIPPVVNFRNILTGTLAIRTVTVRNDGFSSLILGTLSTPVDPFSREGGTCRNGQTLPPDQTCSVKIGFEPPAIGVFESSFDISSNDADERTVTVNVKGRSGFADLTGEWVSLNQSCNITTSGTVCKLSGPLKVKNVGYKNILTASVQYFLSDDGTYDAGDRFLKKFGTGELLFGTSKRFSFGYKLPVGETATGKYVIAVMDINNKIVEIDETNNAIVFGPIP
jgi:hypothetical protein